MRPAPELLRQIVPWVSLQWAVGVKSWTVDSGRMTRTPSTLIRNDVVPLGNRPSEPMQPIVFTNDVLRSFRQLQSCGAHGLIVRDEHVTQLRLTVRHLTTPTNAPQRQQRSD